MKKTKKCILVIVFLVFSVPIPTLLILLNVNPSPVQQTTSGFFYYEGESIGVEGVSWTMYDGLDIELGSGITGSDGIASVLLLTTPNVSGDGIHIEVVWQGGIETLRNIEFGTQDSKELYKFGMASELVWDHDSSLISSEDYIIYDNDTVVYSGTTSALGVISLSHELMTGSFVITILDGTYSASFSIDSSFNQTQYTEEIRIVAERQCHFDTWEILKG